MPIFKSETHLGSSALLNNKFHKCKLLKNGPFLLWSLIRQDISNIALIFAEQKPHTYLLITIDVWFESEADYDLVG